MPDWTSQDAQNGRSQSDHQTQNKAFGSRAPFSKNSSDLSSALRSRSTDREEMQRIISEHFMSFEKRLNSTLQQELKEIRSAMEPENKIPPFFSPDREKKKPKRELFPSLKWGALICTLVGMLSVSVWKSHQMVMTSEMQIESLKAEMDQLLTAKEMTTIMSDTANIQYRIVFGKTWVQVESKDSLSRMRGEQGWWIPLARR